MSWRASAWCLDQVRGIGATPKLVLLALCEYANDENQTWRSMHEIALRSECSQRTIKRHVQYLESLGLISREPLYRWCDDESESCVKRSAHRHRSGTIYTVHMELGEQDFTSRMLEEEHHSPVDKSVDNSRSATPPVDKSTGAKMALVEETAENQGKVHRWQKATCGDGTKSTGGNSAASQVAIVPTICTYNPHINLHPYHPNPSVTFSGVDNLLGVDGVDGKIPGQNCVVEDPGVGVGEPPARSHTAPELPGSCDMHALPDMPGEPSDPGEVCEQSTPGKPCEPGDSGEILPGSPTQGACADSVPGLGGGRVWALLRECIPVSLLALVTGGEKAIVGCLRELVGLGWQPFQIRELLSVAAPPPNVVNGPGLVLHRLSQLKYRDVPDPFVGNSFEAREKRKERFALKAREVLEQIRDDTTGLSRNEQFMWLNRTYSLTYETAYKAWARRLWDQANEAFEARKGVVLRA